MGLAHILPRGEKDLRALLLPEDVQSMVACRRTALFCSSIATGLLGKEVRRRRIVLNQKQKDTLRAWFQKNPNPDLATRGLLAKELGISESQIMTWFQKHRKIQKQVEFEYCFEDSQAQGRDKPKVKEPGRSRTQFTKAQVDTLIAAFKINRFPGIVTREKLAQETGIPESRIHIWFQNRRARHPDTQQGTQATAQLPQNSQCPALKTTGQPPPSTTLPSSLSVTPAFSPPDPQSSPLDLSRGGQKQLSRIIVPQPSQVVQGRGDRPSSSVFNGHLSPVIAPALEAFHPPAPLWLPIQERCQDPSEDSGLAVQPLDGSTQALAVNQLARKDFAFLQHWDEWFQLMLAEWVPDREYWSPGNPELQHPWQMQPLQPAGLPHQADEILQQ